MYVLGYIFGIILLICLIAFIMSLPGRVTKVARQVPTAGNIARRTVEEQEKARAVRDATDPSETYGSQYD